MSDKDWAGQGFCQPGEGKTLAAMTQEVLDLCNDKGWYDKPVSFGEAMALLHSEVSEALEAWRERGLDGWYAHFLDSPIPKPEGVGSEFADVFIRLLDDCARFGIDLEAEYEQKMNYNRTRPYRHGKRQ